VDIQEKTYSWAYLPGKRGQTVYLILHHAAASHASPEEILAAVRKAAVDHPA